MHPDRQQHQIKAHEIQNGKGRHIRLSLAVALRILQMTAMWLYSTPILRENTLGVGLGSNPGEDMDVCKCIVPSRHGGTLNSRRATSPLVRLVDRWDASDHPQGVILLIWGGIELNRTVTCLVLKGTANDRHHLALSHDEFGEPRFGLCRSVRLTKWCFFERTATSGSDVVQSGRPIFDDFFQHLWPYIGNNTANVVFQMVKRL
ncbi:uncharacterized protein TNCV_3339761 [Trichonephila clavipes]|nr:uncharacterized protein TNCV_3339761 [Trichonephila clavipes]